MARRESFLTPMVPKNRKEKQEENVNKTLYGICSQRAFSQNTANISPYFEAGYPFYCYVIKSDKGSLQFNKKMVKVDSVHEWSPQVLHVRELVGTDATGNKMYNLYILIKVDNIHERAFQFAVSKLSPELGDTVNLLKFRKNLLTGEISCDTTETLEVKTPVREMYSKGSPKGTKWIYNGETKTVIFPAHAVEKIAM